MRLRRTLASLPAALLVVSSLPACGTAPSPRSAPPVEAGRAFTLWIHEQGRGLQELYFRNDSDGVYWIQGVTLRDCLNVRPSCERHELDLVACPGETRRLLEVRPQDPMSAFFFNWDVDAERYGSPGDRIGLDCGG